jgi:hypothetical protein
MTYIERIFANFFVNDRDYREFRSLHDIQVDEQPKLVGFHSILKVIGEEGRCQSYPPFEDAELVQPVTGEGLEELRARTDEEALMPAIIAVVFDDPRHGSIKKHPHHLHADYWFDDELEHTILKMKIEAINKRAIWYK